MQKFYKILEKNHWLEELKIGKRFNLLKIYWIIKFSMMYYFLYVANLSYHCKGSYKYYGEYRPDNTSFIL
jgi:hypothetical protein